MRLVDAASPIFARHETFHPRYRWFRKAVGNSQIFNEEDASVQIGVGKNMVKSIRFWGLAAKLIVENKKENSKNARVCVPTITGEAIFGDSGSDKYLENIGTLWLIHWLLLAPRSKLPVWWLAFNEFSAVEFTEAELGKAIQRYLETTQAFNMPSQSSIDKDVGALLRTYSTARQKNTKFDDAFDCPLRELNLIGYSATSGKYRFNLGAKPSLSPEILAFAILNYLARTEHSGKTVPISRLAQEQGAPGKAFKLSESEISMKLEQLCKANDHIELTSTAGASQLAWSGDVVEVANNILTRFYYSDAKNQKIFDSVESIIETTVK